MSRYLRQPLPEAPIRRGCVIRYLQLHPEVPRIGRVIGTAPIRVMDLHRPYAVRWVHSSEVLELDVEPVDVGTWPFDNGRSP